MKTETTSLPGVIRVVPTVQRDNRGFFEETWQLRDLADHGIDATFVQENFSQSTQGTLRGVHYQVKQTQGRLVRVTHGEVFDVAVDLRRSSPNFGRWTAESLSEDNRHQLWIPAGFGHGFFVLSETAGFAYICTDFYAPAHDRSIRWNDPDLGIDWPLAEGGAPILSARDAEAPFLKEAETFE